MSFSCVILLNVVKLSVILLNVVMLSANKLSVVAPLDELSRSFHDFLWIEAAPSKIFDIYKARVVAQW